VEYVGSQKLTNPLLTIPGLATVAVMVTMVPAETWLLGDTASIVVVGEMTTAFKRIVLMARIRTPIRRFTTGGQTHLPLRRIDSGAIDGRSEREAIVWFFGA
jgi:hypothetical protein